MPGPLHGYRIVDLTSNVSGPLATMILGDQGAEIIKVEAPDGGDHTRAGANRRGGFSASFPQQQPQQALDRAEPEGAGRRVEALKRLVADGRCRSCRISAPA